MAELAVLLHSYYICVFKFIKPPENAANAEII